MEKCIICGEFATKYNDQQLPLCKKHETYSLMNMNCPYCKAPLEALRSKYGTFFNCIKCGNISLHRMKQMGSMFFQKR
jgi:ribosomal protein L37AE/L43A